MSCIVLTPTALEVVRELLTRCPSLRATPCLVTVRSHMPIVHAGHPAETATSCMQQRRLSQIPWASAVTKSASTTPPVACACTGAANMDIDGSCLRPGLAPVQELVHTGATPLSLSPTRQLAPAGPAQYPTAAPQCSEPSQPCHTATQGYPTPQELRATTSTTTQAVPAQQSCHALEPTQAEAMREASIRLADATLPAPVAASIAAAVPETPAHRVSQTAQQQQQLARPVASAPAAAQSHSTPALQPQTVQASFSGTVPHSHEPEMLPGTAGLQTTVNSNDAKPAALMPGMADAVLPHSRPPLRDQAAAAGPQQGSQPGQTVATRSNRNGSNAKHGSHDRKWSHDRSGSRDRNESHDRSRSHDRNVSGTRMSLRSRNPAPDKTRRKASSGSRSSGRVRSALEVKAPAYATR